jgi:hypothetical protein
MKRLEKKFDEGNKQGEEVHTEGGGGLKRFKLCLGTRCFKYIRTTATSI